MWTTIGTPVLFFNWSERKNKYTREMSIVCCEEIVIVF